MLYSTPSTRALNEGNTRSQFAPDMSGSGSTIASIAFTNKKSFDKNYPEGTFNMSITDMQDLNSQANYEYYLKFSGEQNANPPKELGETLNYSDTFEYSNTFTKSATDNRAIKAAGYYDLSTISEEPSVSAYSDQQELTEVVDLYKNQIEKTIRDEDEVCGSPCDPSDRIINTDRRKAMRSKCIDQMGQSCFDEVYSFLKQARNKDMADEVIFEAALKKWGKAANGYCLLVDQLLFIER